MPGRYFQTTPIYYVNDRPHLGTAYTMVLADAFARWHRLIGDEVFFLTGTDEHGLKIARTAEEHEMSPKQWTDEAASWFTSAWSALSMSYDDFIRTTEARHHEAVAKFMQAIYDNGYIYKGEYAGWYCVACEAYYKDDELDEGHVCRIHHRPVDWLVEENYFFALSRFEDQLASFYAEHEDALLPESRRNEALGMIRQGLEDISVTRTSFDWGVKVPWDDEHVVYVWYDALVNYITAIGYGTDEERFKSWWPHSHHLIGKDILRFHCVWWPAMCMAAGIDPARHVLAHGWLLVGGEKMGKSRANQVDPVELASDVGVDALRYHLLREITVGADGDFSHEGLIARYNADLANNLGNLLQRVTTIVASKCDGVAPAPPPSSDSRLAAIFETKIAEIYRAWERFAPNDALEATLSLVHETNAELEAKEPWKLERGPELEAVLGEALEVLRIVAVLISPAMPGVAGELWSRIGLEGRPDEPGRGEPASGELIWGVYRAVSSIEKGAPLFPRRSL